MQTWNLKIYILIIRQAEMPYTATVIVRNSLLGTPLLMGRRLQVDWSRQAVAGSLRFGLSSRWAVRNRKKNLKLLLEASSMISASEIKRDFWKPKEPNETWSNYQLTETVGAWSNLVCLYRHHLRPAGKLLTPIIIVFTADLPNRKERQSSTNSFEQDFIRIFFASKSFEGRSERWKIY